MAHFSTLIYVMYANDVFAECFIDPLESFISMKVINITKTTNASSNLIHFILNTTLKVYYDGSQEHWNGALHYHAADLPMSVF